MGEANSGGMAHAWKMPRRRFAPYNSSLNYLTVSIVPAMSHEFTADANDRKRRVKENPRMKHNNYGKNLEPPQRFAHHIPASLVVLAIV